MANNFIQRGDVLTTSNGTGSDVDAGGVLIAGARARIAINDIANGASGPCFAEGVFNLPATSADDWADGANLYWAAGTGKLTDTVGANVFVGNAVALKAALATTANVKLAG